MFRNVIAVINRINKQGDEEESNKGKSCGEGTIDSFMFAWFITGNVWVYQNYLPSFQPKDSNYCDETLYLFAFWLNTSVYIAFGASTCCVCCFACVTEFFCGSNDD